MRLWKPTYTWGELEAIHKVTWSELGPRVRSLARCSNQDYREVYTFLDA
jgi:hypothetical protein